MQRVPGPLTYLALLNSLTSYGEEAKETEVLAFCGSPARLLNNLMFSHAVIHGVGQRSRSNLSRIAGVGYTRHSPAAFVDNRVTCAQRH